MVVLESRMENRKSHKVPNNTLKNKKTTLLLAQDLTYARDLAANEEKMRRRSLRYLKKHLKQRSQANALTEESLKVLWKGLFYSMWMSDKPLVQEECAENISHLIHYLPFEDAMQFFKIGMTALQNEWIGIDQLRLDKFLMFVRRLLRQALYVLKKSNFKKPPNELFGKIIEETILTESAPLGLFMHFTEIYLEELAKVSDGILQRARTIDFLKPYISKLAFSNDGRIIKWINKFIFTHLMKQHKMGLEYAAKYRIWRAQGFEGSINQIQKVVGSDTEPEGEALGSEIQTTAGNKPLDPRAGKVNVELPEIFFNAKEISEVILIPKNDPRTNKTTRNHLKIWSQKFLELHNGIYPLGIKRLEPKERKNLGIIDTNITKAAKRLIKFEQKLLAKDEGKGKKRKIDNLGINDDDSDVTNINMKKKKIKSNTSSVEKSELLGAKVKRNKSKLESLANNPFLAAEVHRVSKEDEKLNKAENKMVLKNKSNKKTAKTSDARSVNASFDDFNFCFERNSGIWVVTPEIRNENEIAESTPADGNTDNEVGGANDGGYEIFVPARKFVKKSKETKINGKVEQVSNKLPGKSRTSLSNITPKLSRNAVAPTKCQLQSGSPKKVVINTRLNCSQEIDDHILRVKSSPQIPWDSNRKPGKPLLKTPIKPSPINPFYKLRRF